MIVWKKWNEFKKTIKSRKVIFWGRGEWVEKTLPYASIDVAFIVDNNKNEQGTREHGYDICAPDTLKDIHPQRNNYYVVITTTDFYKHCRLSPRS